METLLISLLSGGIGTIAGIWYQRHHAGWLKRGDVAADAYEAVISVGNVVRTSQALARRADTMLHASQSEEFHATARSAHWHLGGYAKTLSDNIARLREAEVKVRSTWGDDPADMFARYLQLASAWHNALVEYSEAVIGNISDPDVLAHDDSGYDWNRVIDGTGADREEFEDEMRHLRDLVRRFARTAGVAVRDGLPLTGATGEVIDEFKERQAALPATQRRNKLLPP